MKALQPMSLEPENERDLLLAAIEGDEAALQGLLLAHYREIEAAVRSRFTPELAAHLEVDDLVQEVLVDVHRGIGFYKDSDNSSFAAWLHRITENRIVDTVRYFRRLKRGGGRHRIDGLVGTSHESLDAIYKWVCADNHSPYKDSCVREAREMMQICIAALKEDQRQVIVAHYLDHMDANEIAEEMNRSPAAVRELLRRARTKLASLFGTASAWLSSR